MNPGEIGKKQQTAKFLVAGPPLLFLVLFFVVPSLIMIVTSFRFPGEFGGLAPLWPASAPGSESSGPPAEYGLTLEAYEFFFSDILYARIFLKSFGVAAATTLICLVMAYPLALLIARSHKRLRNLMVLLVVLPFASNFLIRIYAWMIYAWAGVRAQPLHQYVSWRFGLGPVTLLFSPFAVSGRYGLCASPVYGIATLYQS